MSFRTSVKRPLDVLVQATSRDECTRIERAAEGAGVLCVLARSYQEVFAEFLTCPLLSISSFRIFVLQGRRGHQFSTYQIRESVSFPETNMIMTRTRSKSHVVGQKHSC